MYTLYKFHFLNGISEINQLFDDILIIWPAPVCVYIYIYIYLSSKLSAHTELCDLFEEAFLQDKLLFFTAVIWTYISLVSS